MKLIDVVRCKDCKYNVEGRYNDQRLCEMNEYNVVMPYEFCTWGETFDGRKPIEIEAEPVVRCKDCIYRTKEDSPFYAILKGYCDVNDMYVPDDFYCAGGSAQTYREKYHNKIKASTLYGEKGETNND